MYNCKIAKYIQKISVIVGLSVPNLYSYKGLAVFYIIYSFLICFSLIILCSYTIYIELITFKFKFILLLEIVITVTNTFASNAFVLIAIIFFRKKMVKIVKIFMKVNEILLQKFDARVQIPEHKILITFAFLTFNIIVYYIFNTINCSGKYGIVFFTFSVLNYVNVFMMFLIVTQVQLILSSIEQYLQTVNNNFLMKCHSYKENKDTEVEFQSNKCLFFEIYDKLFDLIYLTNEVYMIQSSLLFLIIHISGIQTIILIVSFLNGNEIYKPILTIWRSLIYAVTLCLF